MNELCVFCNSVHFIVEIGDVLCAFDCDATIHFGEEKTVPASAGLMISIYRPV